MNTLLILFLLNLSAVTLCAASSDSDPDVSHLINVNVDSPWIPGEFIFPADSPSADYRAIQKSVLSPLQRDSAKRTFEMITISSSSLSYSSSNSSSDSEDEPISKFQKTVTQIQQNESCDIVHLSQPPIELGEPIIIYQQLQMLQVRMAQLSCNVAALQKQLQSGSYLNQAPPISCDELLDTWNKTTHQFVRATPEDALRITDEFLASVPPENNYKHHFFVQHIFLTKAQLWYNRYTAHLKDSYQSLPAYCSLQARKSLKHAQYYFDLVDPILLGSDKLHHTQISAALQTHLQLNKQLRRAEQYIAHITNRPNYPC